MFWKSLISIVLTLMSAIYVYSAHHNIKQVYIKDKAGQQVGIYKESYALVIGVSNYSAGWPNLPGVKEDLEAVKEALQEHGFHVIIVKDPTQQEMLDAFNSFISTYGRDFDNRLLIYYSGHGYTMKLKWGGDMGYIVPADAPNPHIYTNDFLDKAIDMELIEVYAKRIQSKHVLFLFDSCFSGSIFSLSKAASAAITYKTSKPVRQFITAGSADEEVPDISIFRRQFIAALRGESDYDRDGYLTGSELGEYIQTTVINYSYESQHPQYGKMRNPNLDKGDFVFLLPNPGKQSVTKPIRLDSTRRSTKTDTAINKHKCKDCLAKIIAASTGISLNNDELNGRIEAEKKAMKRIEQKLTAILSESPYNLNIDDANRILEDGELLEIDYHRKGHEISADVKYMIKIPW